MKINIGDRKLILLFTTISILAMFHVTESHAALLPFLGSSMIGNSITRVVTSNSTVYAYNYSYPLHMVGKAGLTVTGSNSSGTVYLTAPAGVLPPTTTCANGYGFYKYNQTSNTYSCASFNGVNSTNAVTSVNALSGAITIAGVAGNTTTTVVGQTITVNTAWNIVTTGGAVQRITKELDLDNLKLTGNANGNSKNFTNFNQVNATKFYQNGNLVVDTLQANSPITVSQNHGNSITVSCPTCSTSSSTTVNSFSPTVNIVRQLGNTTISNSSGTITVGLGVNPVISGGSAQTVTKGLTLNSLTLGGAENANSNQINNVAAPTHSTDATPANVVGEIGSLVVGKCSSGQGLAYQTSNSTWICTNLASNGVSSINSQTGPSITLNRGTVTNMSAITNSSNIISYQMKNNIILTNGSAQTVTKSLTTNSLTLGGNENANSNKITSLATPTLSTDAQVANHLGLLGSLVVGACANNQVLAYQSSNTTFICSTASTGTITGSHNGGKATGSVGVLAAATSTQIIGRNMTGTSPITITKTNDTDISIACSTCVTSAVTSLSVNAPLETTGSTGAITLSDSNGVATNETYANNKGIANKTKEINFINATGFTFNIIKSKSHEGTANQAINVTGTNTGVTSITGTNGNLTASVSTGAVILNTGNNLAYLASTQTFTGANTFSHNTNTFTAATSGLLISNVANTHAYTVAGGAITANETITLPVTREAEKFAVQPTLLFTATANKTGTTSTAGVMTGYAISFTPEVTGRVLIVVSGYGEDNTAGDGYASSLRYGTSTAPTNGAALTGTLVGNDVLGQEKGTTASLAASAFPFTINGIVTGLTPGTTYWIDLSESAVGGGTATLFNVNVSIIEL